MCPFQEYILCYAFKLNITLHRKSLLYKAHTRTPWPISFVSKWIHLSCIKTKNSFKWFWVLGIWYSITQRLLLDLVIIFTLYQYSIIHSILDIKLQTYLRNKIDFQCWTCYANNVNKDISINILAFKILI
jgi:hypothetical protein